MRPPRQSATSAGITCMTKMLQACHQLHRRPAQPCHASDQCIGDSTSTFRFTVQESRHQCQCWFAEYVHLHQNGAMDQPLPAKRCRPLQNSCIMAGATGLQIFSACVLRGGRRCCCSYISLVTVSFVLQTWTGSSCWRLLASSLICLSSVSPLPMALRLGCVWPAQKTHSHVSDSCATQSQILAPVHLLGQCDACFEPKLCSEEAQPQNCFCKSTAESWIAFTELL